MGVTLDYTTIEPIPVAVRSTILAEVAEVMRDWWCESILFHPDSDDGRLYGGNKIFLVGYTATNGRYVSIDPDEDYLMAWRDASFIIALLSEWSERFGIAWSISCVGEPVGNVENGYPDQGIREFLIDCATTAGIDPADPSLPSRSQAISPKYASRW